MKSYAAIAALASTAAAVAIDQAMQVESTEYVAGEWEVTIDVLEDAKVAVAMPQGSGRDHTDWSWHFEHMQAWDEMEEAKADVIGATIGLTGAELEYQNVLKQMLSPQVEFQRNCQLHREEEINLYYQCTQNDINNYALHHFGGHKRSYPRWAEEYNVCIDHIHTAKLLHLDYFHEDGTTTLEPCEPQTHTNSVYIGDYDHMEHTDMWVQGTLITAEPLNPMEDCSRQSIPDWSGLWIEVWEEQEAWDIMMGRKMVDSKYTERCYTVQPTADPNTARLLETWDEPEPRDYDLTLRHDKRFTPNGCMIHTHLKGTDYTQWVSGLPGQTEVTMNQAMVEQWHVITPEGEEVYEKSHYEIRIGGCHPSADERKIHEKHYTPGVKVAPMIME